MEIRIYSPGMEFLGIIENFRSLLWNRSYNGCGDFELHVPVTPYALTLFHRENLVWKKGAADAGIIETRHIEETADANELVVSGRFLPAYMDRRLVRPLFNFSGRAEVAMRNMLTNASTIPHVQLDTLHGFPEYIQFQATYKKLLTIEQKVAKAAGFGFRFRPDFTEKKITMEIYKGADRSIAQSDRARVIFSADYGNLSRATYDDSTQLYANVCYVGGQGEGTERTFVTVGDDSLTGLARREIFINGSDISPEGLTDAEYLEKLRQRGRDTLEEHQVVQAMECELLPSGNFTYLKDYDVGDIVTVRKDNWDVSQNLRITGISEIYEDGAMKIEPTIGTPLPETINWEED